MQSSCSPSAEGPRVSLGPSVESGGVQSGAHGSGPHLGTHCSWPDFPLPATWTSLRAVDKILMLETRRAPKTGEPGEPQWGQRSTEREGLARADPSLGQVSDPSRNRGEEFCLLR